MSHLSVAPVARWRGGGTATLGGGALRAVLRGGALLCVLGLWLACLGLSSANEPDGRLRFSSLGASVPSRPVPGLEAGEHLVTVQLEAVTPIHGGVLVRRAPPGVSERLISIRRGGALEMIDRERGEGPSRFALGDLKPGDPLTIEIAARISPGAGGILTITVEFPAAEGVPAVSESYGIVVGTPPGRQGVVRQGAIEYPANEIQESAP